jgi:hypothetical protein
MVDLHEPGKYTSLPIHDKDSAFGPYTAPSNHPKLEDF